MDFTDKIAIVTGGASGMGAATARELAAAGAKVVIVDRNAELATAVAHEINATTAIGDVSDPDFCQKVVDKTVGEYGRLDILINAAGIIVRADALGTTNEQWQRVMNVNVSAIFYLSRAAVAVMKKQGKGAIVNFGSIWGGVGAAGVVA